jgi:prepilin-type N-terminal cleavage/methylation domain-containing protein
MSPSFDREISAALSPFAPRKKRWGATFAERKATLHGRYGLTLVELLMTIAVVGLIGAALAALATAVEQGSQYTNGHGAATQGARVALGRIRHHVETATATADFPGFAVFGQTVGAWAFPDTLVVWHPSAAPANAAGPPLFSELIIYCPSPTAPHELLEITIPGYQVGTPPLSSRALWLSELDAIKSSGSARRVTLLGNLRTARPSDFLPPRGCVRFAERVSPSASDWNSYLAGSTDWGDLPWALDIHGSQTGLRQAWCRVELQLDADPSPSGESPLAFFGSAALNYMLRK